MSSSISDKDTFASDGTLFKAIYGAETSSSDKTHEPSNGTKNTSVSIERLNVSLQ